MQYDELAPAAGAGDMRQRLKRSPGGAEAAQQPSPGQRADILGTDQPERGDNVRRGVFR